LERAQKGKESVFFFFYFSIFLSAGKEKDSAYEWTKKIQIDFRKSITRYLGCIKMRVLFTVQY
jgi:hypothetical protein